MIIGLLRPRQCEARGSDGEVVADIGEQETAGCTACRERDSVAANHPIESGLGRVQRIAGGRIVDLAVRKGPDDLQRRLQDGPRSRSGCGKQVVRKRRPRTRHEVRGRKACRDGLRTGAIGAVGDRARLVHRRTFPGDKTRQTIVARGQCRGRRTVVDLGRIANDRSAQLRRCNGSDRSTYGGARKGISIDRDRSGGIGDRKFRNACRRCHRNTASHVCSLVAAGHGRNVIAVQQSRDRIVRRREARDGAPIVDLRGNTTQRGHTEGGCDTVEKPVSCSLGGARLKGCCVLYEAGCETPGGIQSRVG